MRFAMSILRCNEVFFFLCLLMCWCDMIAREARSSNFSVVPETEGS